MTFYDSRGRAIAYADEDEIIYLYLARGLSSGEQALSDFELINVERVSLDALRRMIDDGTINDGKRFVPMRVRKSKD